MSKNSKITLNEYLSEYSKKRNMDKIIKNWYQNKEKMNVSKSKNEWDQIVEEFYNETDK